jgi:hypothetical protein
MALHRQKSIVDVLLFDTCPSKFSNNCCFQPPRLGLGMVFHLISGCLQSLYTDFETSVKFVSSSCTPTTLYYSLDCYVSLTSSISHSCKVNHSTYPKIAIFCFMLLIINHKGCDIIDAGVVSWYIMLCQLVVPPTFMVV